MQASNRKVFVAYNTLVGAGSHPLNICFPLHWWCLGRRWTFNLGVQICWSKNLETPVCLGL